MLESFPGVGPKMAHLCMDIAWGHMTRIGVCTHMNQIIHQLGWVKGALDTPEWTRQLLEQWLSRCMNTLIGQVSMCDTVEH